MLGDCAESAGFLPLLGMGRDIPEGIMQPAERRAADRLEEERRPRRSTSSACATSPSPSPRELGGTFLDNPIWLLSRVVTVHALGGAPMGRDDREGVVDPYGRVYNYPGLHIADGSVMPGPVGPNPSLTIAGLADRFADAILEDMKGPTVTAPPPPPDERRARRRERRRAGERAPRVTSSSPRRCAASSRSARTTTTRAFAQGKKSKTKCMFHVTVPHGGHRALHRRAGARGLDHGPRRVRRARRRAGPSSRAGSTSSSTTTRTARSASS